MTTPPQDSLVQSIVQALDEREVRLREASDTQWGSIRRLVKFKDIAQAIIFFGALIAGAVLTFAKLNAKPSIEEVDEAIDMKVEERAIPIEESIDDLSKGMARVETRVTQLESSSQEILDEVVWQGKVLDCLVDKCKVPPKRPGLKP